MVMRRHAHIWLAALLCVCLLVSSFSANAEAAQPSVGASGSIGGDGVAYTSVNVLAAADFVIRVSEDFAATVAEIQASPDLYVLKAVASGQSGDLSYRWSRTVDGEPDEAFSWEGAEVKLADWIGERAGGIENNREYVYTVEVSDEAGHSASASVTVATFDGYMWGTRSDNGVVVEGTIAREAVLAAGELDPTSPTYAHLLASADGKRIAGAWQADLGGTQGGRPAYTGVLSVALPACELADGTEVTVIGLCSNGTVTHYSGIVAGGSVTIDSPVLGVFAVAVADHDSTAFTVTATAGEGGQITPCGKVSYAEGATPRYVVLADSGHVVDKVLVDGRAAALEGNSYAFEPVRADHTINVTFKAIEPDDATIYHLAAFVEGGNGRVSIAGGDPATSVEGEYPHGSSVQVELVPDEGYTVGTLTVDGQEHAVLGASFLVPCLTADTEVRVTFVPGAAPPLPVHTVEAAVAGGGGTISPEHALVPHGRSVSFALVPDQGYELEAVALDGGDVTHRVEQAGGATLVLENVVADHSLSATFKKTSGENPDPGPGPKPDPDDPFVTVNVKVEADAEGGEGGMVSPSGELVVVRGVSQRFYVFPEVGYDIDQVLVNGEPVEVHPLSPATLYNARSTVGAGGGYWFEVSADKEGISVRVSFKKLGEGDPAPPPIAVHKVSSTATSGGMISPEGDMLVPDGGALSFTLRADEGFYLASLSVNGADAVDRVEDFTFELSEVTGDVVVEAVFEPEQQPPPPIGEFFTIEVTAGPHGTVSDLGGMKTASVQVAKGADKAFFFLPEAGFSVGSVRVDGEQVPASSCYVFANVQSDHALEVEFKPQAGSAPADPGQAFGRFAQTGDVPFTLAALFAACAAGVTALASWWCSRRERMMRS